MKEPVITFECDGVIARQLYEDIFQDETIELFQHTGLGQKIGYVATNAVIQAYDSVHQLHISSEIEYGDAPSTAPAALLSTMALRLQELFERYSDSPYYHSIASNGSATINNHDQDAHLGHSIVSLGGGRSWAINSAVRLDAGRTAPEQDIPAIHELLLQHAETLGTLCTRLESPIETSHRFSFSFPGEEAQAETDTPQPVAELMAGPVIKKDPFERFVGVDSVVRQLQDVVRLANIPAQTLKHHDIERTHAVLLNGPSGVGKTALIRAFGEALEAKVDEVEYRDASGSHVSEAAHKIEARFRDAYKSKERTLIFLDELDGLLNVGNSEVNQTIISMLKTELEKIKKHPHVFFAAATNNIDDIDPVLCTPKRIPVTIEIGMPTDAQKAKIFHHYVLGSVIEEALGSSDIQDVQRTFDLQRTFDFDELAREAWDFSGSDIREAVQYVKRQKLLQSIESETFAPLALPTQAELLEAIQQIRRRD